MTRLALRLDVTGDITELDLDSDKGAYQTLRDAVGNWIEALDFAHFYTYVDEEGLYSGAVFNPYASAMVQAAYAPRATVPINGPMVFVGETDDEGETTGLTSAQASNIRNTVAGAKDYAPHMFEDGYVPPAVNPVVTVTTW